LIDAVAEDDGVFTTMALVIFPAIWLMPLVVVVALDWAVRHPYG
jgi:hypothetical protein